MRRVRHGWRSMRNKRWPPSQCGRAVGLELVRLTADQTWTYKVILFLQASETVTGSSHAAQLQQFQPLNVINLHSDSMGDDGRTIDPYMAPSRVRRFGYRRHRQHQNFGDGMLVELPAS